MVWVLPHVPTEHMQINLKAQAVLIEKIERSKELGELSSEHSVSTGAAKKILISVALGLYQGSDFF